MTIKKRIDNMMNIAVFSH